MRVVAAAAAAAYREGRKRNEDEDVEGKIGRKRRQPLKRRR